VSVVQYEANGPCAFIRVTSRNPEAVVAPRFGGVLAGAIVIGMLLSIFGTFWLIVRPLRSRIEELAAAAQSVGSDTFAPQPGDPDALGHIATALTRSHERIIESRDALEERNQALERHLAGIAHDLRTPLSSMHLALEALSTESKGSVQREAQRALADAVYLSSMVENLHQAARLRHEIEVASGSVELTDLVHRLEKRFAIVGRHAGVEVAANTPEREVWVACTPALAERAVANLVQNAVEHNNTKPGDEHETEPGHVAITLSLKDSGSRFELLVADDGPGLPEETLASLQNETFLVEDARPRGPGMGMLITREVARRAGWSLSYDVLETTGLRVRLEGPVTET
jgi:signal transduction histidine kinase